MPSYRKIKFAKYLLIFTILTGWLFSGWPRVLNFPPQIKPAQAALSVKYGSFAKPNSTTGNQSINDVGFQPKVVIFFGNYLTADGSAASAQEFFGAAVDSTHRAVIASASNDAAATSQSDKRWSNALVITQITPPTPTVDAEADFVSMDTGGFTINWTTCDASQRIINYLAIGGTDLTNVDVGSFTAPTAAGDKTVTGVGFEPDAIILFDNTVTTTPTAAGNSASSAFNLSFIASTTSSIKGNNRVTMRQDNIATGNTWGYQTTASDQNSLSGAGAIVRTATVKGMNSDGFVMNFSVAPANAVYISYIAFKGGQYAIGNFDQNTSTGNQSVSGLGFQPSGVIFQSANIASSTSVSSFSRISLGVGISSSQRGSIWSGDRDAADPTIADQYLDRTKALVMYLEGTHTLETAMDYVSNDSGGFTVNNTTASSTLSASILYFAFGAAAAAPVDPTISSAANQTFTVGDGTTAMSTVTITEGSPATITDTNNIRIKIPATFNMVWDTDDTLANIGGTDWAKTGAASQGGTVTVSWEDSNKTVVIPVTSDFSASDDITVYGLNFETFSGASSADNLELEVDNAGTTIDTDDKTITINAAAGTATISSAAGQSFETGQAATAISTITITDAATPTITDANNLRIKIPATFNMVWDTDDALANIGGTDWAKTGAASQGATVSVTFEDTNKTVVIPVTTDFAASDDITVYGLNFETFSGASSADNLELETANNDTTAAYDDKTITITAGTITVASAVAQVPHTSANTTDNVLGVASIVRNQTSGTVTAITLKENAGTITANTELSNIELWLSYNKIWDASDEQLDTAKSFDGADGEATFTETFTSTTSPRYLIVRADVASGATAGDTIEVQLKTVTTYDTVSGTALEIADTTTNTDYWWNNSWTHRNKVSFNNLDSTTDLTDFPVMVEITNLDADVPYADFGNSGGTDIRFVDSNNSNELKYEIERWDDTASSTIWVKIPQINDATNLDFVYIYYGNAGVAAGADPANVWTNGYRAVYHFAEQSGNYLDSTSYNNDSNTIKLDYDTDSGRDKSDGDGLGYYPKFNSNGGPSTPSTLGDYVGVPDPADGNLDFGTGDFTLHGRIRTPVVNYDCDLFRKGSTGVVENAWWKLEWGDQVTNDRINYLVRSNSVDQAITYVFNTDNQWHDFWGVRDVSNSQIRLYVDGVYINQAASNNYSVSNSANIGIGSKDDYADDFCDGNIDEVRYEVEARTADWIRAQHLSMEDEYTAFGAQEDGGGGGSASTLAQAAYKWFVNDNSTAVGRAGGPDQPTSAPSQGVPFRLRLLLHVGAETITQNGTTSLLQFAARSGTCDTGFSGESYSNVSSTTGAIRYYNNAGATDGDPLTASSKDPRHYSDTVRNQVYSEGSNNFINSQSAIAAGEDGLWDFSLVDYSAAPNTHYCFRVIQAGGGVISSYEVIPETTTYLPMRIKLRNNVTLRKVFLR